MKLIAGLTFCFVLLGGSKACFAETIATMPNQGGGKIVLTDEVCKAGSKTYNTLRRAYNYTVEGYGSEGCYYIEDESVMVIWDTAGTATKRRYPAENFTINKKARGYGT